MSENHVAPETPAEWLRRQLRTPRIVGFAILVGDRPRSTVLQTPHVRTVPGLDRSSEGWERQALIGLLEAVAGEEEFRDLRRSSPDGAITPGDAVWLAIWLADGVDG